MPAPKKLLAISGGIDSIVMLALFLRHFDHSELIVAHFDHGTRPSSRTDAEFVAKFCQQHRLAFISERAELGETVSESLARQARYSFLSLIAKELNAEIYTAHHLDDLCETIAINFLRGTGWRGLAALDRPGIHRPFLDGTFFTTPPDKSALHRIAAEQGITYRADPTNQEPHYLRNRVRAQLSLTHAQKLQLYTLWQKQLRVKAQVAAVLPQLLSAQPEVARPEAHLLGSQAQLRPSEPQLYPRAWFRELDENLALEFLRFITNRWNISCTRPQLQDFFHAIKTYHSGKAFNLPSDHLVKFTRDAFYLQS